jgi:ankyrin repeat protein
MLLDILNEDQVLAVLSLFLPSLSIRLSRCSRIYAEFFSEELLSGILPYVAEALDVQNANPFELAFHGDLERLWLMLVLGLDIRVRDEEGGTLLQRAVHGGEISVLRLLIERHLAVNGRGANGYTPLHEVAYASPEKSEKITEFLLQCRGNPDALSASGSTPMLVAARMGAVPVLRTLLKGGADAEDGGDKPWTPLVVAAAAGHAQAVKTLLEYGARADLQFEEGRTALHEAVELNHLDVVKQLIKADADVEIPDDHGRTPLHIAREIGNTKAMTLLIKVKPRKQQLKKKPEFVAENELASLTKTCNRGRSLIHHLPDPTMAAGHHLSEPLLEEEESFDN